MKRLQKTAEQVKEDFLRQGISISGWAKQHGFSKSTVHRVIAGETHNRWGKAHKVAVLLGMKDGVIGGKFT
jgi:gp16 family phage-associated protein